MIRSLVLAAALLAAPAAFAQDAPPAPAGAEGGGYGRNASPEMREARQKMMESCAADFQKFCSDAQAGGGGRMQCLREHASDLSEGCRAAMQSMRAMRQGGRAPSPQG